MSTINRVATANMYENSIRNIGARQNSLVEQNEKLTAGKRVLRASDDPVAAAQAERAITRMERIKVEQQALDIQRNGVAQAESSIGDAIGLIQNIRELMVSAGSGTLAQEDRRIIAGQIDNLRDQLINVANRKDTNGLPLLGALGSALTPFLGNSPDSFGGLAGQIGGSAVGIANMLDGDSAFMFQTKRDGVYTAELSNTATPLAGRKFGTSEITVLDPKAVTGAEYEIVFGAVQPAPGTPPDPYNSIATYTIIDKNNTPLGDVTVTTAPFPNDKPKSIDISLPGLKFTINASPYTDENRALPPGTFADAAGGVTPGIRAGDTITLKPSSGIFESLDRAVAGIGKAADSNAAAQAVGQGLASLDRGMERLQSMRSYAGELLNRADRITGDQETRNIQLDADRSRAEDLDLVQGSSDFQMTQVGYQAALQSYAMVQKMSMFNYIS